MLDHVAFGRKCPNAKNVIDSKSLEHCSCEKPVPTFSRNALGRPRRGAGPGLGVLALLALAGCKDSAPVDAQPPLAVLTQTAGLTPRAQTVSLTGEIKARIQSDLSFRFAGRIATRSADVGDRVVAGQVLATLETTEQKADTDSATASVQAAEATLRQASATFERQKSLLANGYTTQRSYDNANEAYRAAQASLDSAKANLATAQDQLSYTALRAEAPGIITARNAEVGQVVETAQAVFTVARDGARDAVFDVYEALLVQKPADGNVEIALISNPAIKVTGTVREVAPVVDPTTGSVRVKIGIDQPPPEMTLGAAVSGVGRFQPRDVFALPWTAFFTQGGKAAVWVVDPKSRAVSLKPVVIDIYRTGEVLIRSGLSAGDVVVTGGAQLLRPGQIVAPTERQPTALLPARAGNAG
jgi:RND family efflux transporter MFP subunit